MLELLLGLLSSLAVQGRQPAVKSGVDLVAIDAHIVDRSGKPITDLRPEDVEVRIAGRPRRVVSLELVSYAGVASTVPSGAGGATDPGLATPRPRRMFVLAIDEHSLHASTAMAAVHAAERFIDRLQPDDLVGVYAYPTGNARHDLTSDHAAVRRALRSITGLFEEPYSRFHMSPSEIIDCASGDADAQRRVLQRECPRGGCTLGDIRQEAVSLAVSMEMRVTQSLGGLRGLIRGLAEVPGRKVLVLVSSGLITTDRATGRANAAGQITQLGRDAAGANLSVYALHLDWSFVQALSGRSGIRLSYFRDSNLAATGLEMVAGAAGGAMLRVQGTSPDVAFDRVLRETSAHYLIGVEASDEERDGQPHAIRVSVRRRGTDVRSRSEVVVPRR
jgi:VWFA-related protein